MGRPGDRAEQLALEKAGLEFLAKLLLGDSLLGDGGPEGRIVEAAGEVVESGDGRNVAVDHLPRYPEAVLAAEDGGGREVDQLLEHLLERALARQGRHIQLRLLAAKPGQLALDLVGQLRGGELLAADARHRGRAHPAKAAHPGPAGAEARDDDRDQADDEDDQHDLRHEAAAEKGEHLAVGPALVRAGHRSAAGLGQAWHLAARLLGASPSSREGPHQNSILMGTRKPGPRGDPPRLLVPSSGFRRDDNRIGEAE